MQHEGHEGDDLYLAIRAYVTGRVPVAYEDLITELTAKTVVLVMTTPAFYLHLTYVQALHQEIARLQQPTRKRTPPKTVPKPRKAPPRPAVKKAQPRSQPRTRTGQFKRGASGR
jgi:hypothetical protein